MVQSRDSRIASIQFCTALLLLSRLTPALRADQIESSPGKTTAESTPSHPERIDAKALPQSPLPLWCGDLSTRSQLTGHWAGARDALAEHGLTFFADLTQYDQGVTSGGLEQQFKYGGRGDYLIDFDSQKMGLWQGGHLDLRDETRLGQDCNQIDGSVAPTNFAMALPRIGQNVTALTCVQYTQDLSENVSIFLGKLNLLDGTPASYTRGLRLNYFFNAAMQSNLSRSYLISESCTSQIETQRMYLGRIETYGRRLWDGSETRP